MTKYILFILTFKLLPGSIRAQELFPMENAFWQTTLQCGVDTFRLDVFSCQDSFYQGKVYQRLYETIKTQNTEQTYPLGWYRTENEKVFFRNGLGPGSGFGVKEYLLYDFSLEPGDSVKLVRIWFTPTSLTIFGEAYYSLEQKPDSIAMPQGWRKRWLVNAHSSLQPFQETWIEGLGSTYGPLIRFSCDTVLATAEVQCFWHHGTIEYQKDPAALCDIQFPPDCLATLNTSPSKDQGVFISPNPFTDALQVSLSADVKPFGSLQLYDMLGRSVPTHWLTTGNSYILDRGSLPNGIYFLCIQSADNRGKVRVFKVIAE